MAAQFTYVYILESKSVVDSYYIGVTEDLTQRLKRHNAGSVPHTAKLLPWVITSAIALRDRERAFALERYLKTHAGRTFAKNHL